MKNVSRFDMSGLIKKFAALHERQGKKEAQALKMLEGILDAHAIPYLTQTFQTKIPQFGKSYLYVDGENIPARATSFVGGKITNNYAILSSLISSQKNIKDANINFNPLCKGISRSNHYFAPALAVHRKNISKICNAKNIHGVVRVRPYSFQSGNILVGNSINSKSILFCHYDSFGPGALDNASGVAVLLKLVIDNPDILKHSLIVFAGNEELSYDFPVYWGHGYRVFERRYTNTLAQATHIFAVDCVGNGKPVFDNTSSTVPLAFPIQNLKKWENKIFAVYGDAEKLMSVYHSDLDTANLVKKKFLNETVAALQKRIKN